MRDRQQRMKMKSRNRDRGESREDRGSGFKYKRRDPAALRKQANQSGGMYDNPFRTEFSVFSPRAGKSYRIRYMPPTWDDADHYAFPVQVHSQVGTDNNKYICLAKHKDGEACPVCEEVVALKKAGEDDDAYQLKDKTRKAAWVIDRDNESEGPKIWAPSWVTDKEIAALAIDERTNETYYLDDPEEGYDVEFKVVQDGQYPKISAIKIARRPSPLSDSEKQAGKWLRYIEKHPIPTTLQFFDYEHIAKVLAGGKTKDDDDEDDRGTKTRSERKHKRDDDRDERTSRKSSFRDADEEDEDDDVDEEEEDDTDEEGEDEEDDVEDEDDEEDNKPRKSRPKLKKPLRRDADTDEDDDEDDDEEGGSDDEAGTKQAKGSRRDHEQKRSKHQSSEGRKAKGLKPLRSRHRDDEDDDD